MLEHRPSASYGEEVATGETLFANALSMAASRATLGEVLTDEFYERATAAGHRLADGIETVAEANGLPWRAHQLFNRSGYTHAPELPANALQARATFDRELYNLQRLHMANRGIWEAIDSAGPAVSAGGRRRTAATRYLEAFDRFLDELER